MFRGIDDVYNELHPLLAKHKVFTVPEVLSSESTFETTSKGGKLFYEKMMIRYTFYANDGSSVQATVKGVGMDSGDKAANKAMAIGHKYALLQVFTIPTKDMADPDSETPPDSMDQRQPDDRRPPATGRPAPAQQPATAAAAPQGPRPTRRPVAGRGRQEANPAKTPPSADAANDLPYTMDPQVPDENKLIGETAYDRIVIGVKLKKIGVEKWRKWLLTNYKTDSAKELPEGQQNEIVDTIYNHPELIDPGMEF